MTAVMRIARTPATLLFAVIAAAVASAQSIGTATLDVSESAGIRRTEFPTRASFSIPRGRLDDVTHVRLEAEGVEVPSQGTAMARWDDGSVRTLELDFNVTIGPLETRRLQLRYGSSIVSEARPRGALAVVEDADALQVGNLRFGRRGAPLVLSANYRGELIASGNGAANGLTVADAAGVSHAVEWRDVTVVKGGPVVVHLRYSGQVALGGSTTAPVTLDLEMPNSKSWFRLTAAVEDPTGRAGSGALTFALPLALGAHPWTWDVGTGNATYGAFRTAQDSATLTETAAADGRVRWQITTGTAGQERPYEVSPDATSVRVRGWAHVQDAAHAVAFAVENWSGPPGRRTMQFSGDGQVRFTIAPERSGDRVLVLYAHFVTTPVAIGAATSPASILSPLLVRVAGP